MMSNAYVICGSPRCSAISGPTCAVSPSTACLPQRIKSNFKMAAKKKEIPVLTEEDIPAISLERCGLSGSPTKVKKTYTPVTEKNGVKLEGMEAEDAAKEVVKLIYDAKIL